IRIGRGSAEKGTEVRVELPLAALTSPAAGENAPPASPPAPAPSPAPPSPPTPAPENVTTTHP
ncbi:two-component sensor histidine kinase, partial [Streptomyces sp. SID7499]|nr:two-component sensor histidine kinase [Streptomyces sp. SID7499]